MLIRPFCGWKVCWTASAQADPDSREKAQQLVQIVMELYGAGLRRVIQILRDGDGADFIGRLSKDKLVGSLLLLHELHPEDAEASVRAALHRLERGLDSHQLVLTEIGDGVAKIRVDGNGKGAPPALAEAIERAVAECAPDLAGVEIEGLSRATSGLLQIELASSH